MNLLSELSEWVESKPIILLRFPDGLGQYLLESRRGIGRFTFAKPHEEFRELKLPTLCLAEMPDGDTGNCYVGVVTSKAAVTTFESRITVIGLQPLTLASLDALVTRLVDQRQKTALRQKLETPHATMRLSPVLSRAIIEELARDPYDRQAVEAAARNVPHLRHESNPEWEQLDAIKVAVAAFGLSPADLPHLLEVPQGSDSTLVLLGARVLEDNVIARDASSIPGFSLVEKYATGRAVFRKGDEHLEVYTANKGPLETMLGVDLIYVNGTVGNTVMLQYKMLEKQGGENGRTDWTFRPDNQLRAEIARMKLPPLAGKTDDYRLHRSPFFFKFVKREGDGHSHTSFVISLDHLNFLIASPDSRGSKGGVRVSFHDLGGAYLRETDFINLIRTGYVGTHRVESAALRPIIAQVAKNDRALVLAWQRRLATDSESSTATTYGA